MTLPASGAIAVSQTNTERGVAGATSMNFGWLKSYTKGAPAAFPLSFLYSKAWFAISKKHYTNYVYDSNLYGAAYSGTDTQPYFQANCNCADCLYDCNCPTNCGDGA